MQHAIKRFHCATSKSSLWNMEYVDHGGAFERPHIYRTNMYVQCHVKVTIVHVLTSPISKCLVDSPSKEDVH